MSYISAFYNEACCQMITKTIFVREYCTYQTKLKKNHNKTVILSISNYRGIMTIILLFTKLFKVSSTGQDKSSVSLISTIHDVKHKFVFEKLHLRSFFLFCTMCTCIIAE